jgi:hypothetical protein
VLSPVRSNHTAAANQIRKGSWRADEDRLDLLLRPDTDPRTGRYRAGFETVAQCQAEDLSRALALRALPPMPSRGNRATRTDQILLSHPQLDDYAPRSRQPCVTRMMLWLEIVEDRYGRGTTLVFKKNRSPYVTRA